MALLKGWRYGVFISGIVGLIGLAIYPVVIDPMLHTDKYKEVQKHNRAGVNQEAIQPGNMKVWSDPFGRK
ncbi:small integral membrane protein 20 [Teleopsis dalmanni]|uniref:small integral membrane protein 20 n=1 Tax=Teleopsis dalmanni TaxID=139649 RepID=UPI0018CC93CC|nr:small integral membrane protein 20 [Teleopsis dalmanni]